MSATALREQLFREILLARQRVYEAAAPTPLEEIPAPIDAYIALKREDLSPIHAYKWRGAYYRMTKLAAKERAAGVICASAGNHAQGVALAARKMGVRAKIYMPLSTPRMKKEAVRRHGGDAVEVVLHGDSFADAQDEALRVMQREKRTYIHPYDDLATMAGQGTLADEVVMSGQPPFDIAYLQIGGGGMAAAAACWLRTFYPGIRLVGVEGTGQASMAAAIAAGQPVDLPYVDVFADGTAVRRAGELTWQLCAELLDEMITVSNEEICAAIQTLWETRRIISEPSGAMGLAGALQQRDALKGRRVLAILCGSNMDFGQLAWISRHAGIGSAQRRYFRFKIREDKGTLLSLIEEAMEGVNIVEFQYGKVHEKEAYPVIGVEAGPMEMAALRRRLDESGFSAEDVTSQQDVEFRMIHYDSKVFRWPWFIKLEFPERPGALRDFLHHIKGLASICYFNYSYTGERVGRALLGFEFAAAEDRGRLRASLKETHWIWQEIDEAVLRRIL